MVKNAFTDIWQKYKAEMIVFFVGISVFILTILLGVMFTSYMETWAELRTYVFSLLVGLIGLTGLFVFLLNGLNKAKMSTFVLIVLFIVNIAVCVLAFIFDIAEIKDLKDRRYYSDDYISAKRIDLIRDIIVMVAHIIFILLLIKTPKNGSIIFNILIVSILVFALISFVVKCAVMKEVFSVAEILVDLAHLIIYASYYIETYLVLTRYCGYKSVFARKPSAIEQELISLKDKKDLGLITEEEYAAKRSEIIKKLQEK